MHSVNDMSCDILTLHVCLIATFKQKGPENTSARHTGWYSHKVSQAGKLVHTLTECPNSISIFHTNYKNYATKGPAKIQFIATFTFSFHFIAMFVCTFRCKQNKYNIQGWNGKQLSLHKCLD